MSGSNIKAVEKAMLDAAKNLEFEKAARLRDEIRRLEAQELELPPGMREDAAAYRAGPAQRPRPRSKLGAPFSPRGRARRPQRRSRPGPGAIGRDRAGPGQRRPPERPHPS
mgnify:CR=1 FL=1